MRLTQVSLGVEPQSFQVEYPICGTRPRPCTRHAADGSRGSGRVWPRVSRWQCEPAVCRRRREHGWMRGGTCTIAVAREAYVVERVRAGGEEHHRYRRGQLPHGRHLSLAQPSGRTPSGSESTASAAGLQIVLGYEGK